MRALAKKAARPSLTLIHDVKHADRCQYPGWKTTDPATALDNVPDGATSIVFRNDPYAGIYVNPDDVCALALRLARARMPVRLCIDELSKVVTDGGKALTAPSFRECNSEGGAMGLSIISSTQDPHRCPETVLASATAVVIGNLGPREVNYLDGPLCFDSDMMEIVPTLQKGQFVIRFSGESVWDRTVYTCPKDDFVFVDNELEPAVQDALKAIPESEA